ncbi:MAG: hypothetical protein OXU20_04710 [Myxococcales bacterium]|nr:hypothetical protein [Myxococcales bacterium]
MKPQETGLLAIATLRKERLRQAQRALAEARALMNAAEEIVLAARAELSRHVEAAPAPPVGRVSGARVRRAGEQLQRYHRVRVELERDLATAQGNLQGARKRVERAREALSQAHLEAQLVDRVAERRQIEARRQRERHAEE